MIKYRDETYKEKLNKLILDIKSYSMEYMHVSINDGDLVVIYANNDKYSFTFSVFLQETSKQMLNNLEEVIKKIILKQEIKKYLNNEINGLYPFNSEKIIKGKEIPMTKVFIIIPEIFYEKDLSKTLKKEFILFWENAKMYHEDLNKKEYI